MDWNSIVFMYKLILQTSLEYLWFLVEYIFSSALFQPSDCQIQTDSDHPVIPANFQVVLSSVKMSSPFEDSFLSSAKSCFYGLSSLQTELVGKRIASSQSFTKEPAEESDFAFTTNGILSRAVDDAQTMLEMMKYIEFIEKERNRFQTDNLKLIQDNTDLQEELERIKQKLAICEQNLIQMEIEKEHLEFLSRCADIKGENLEHANPLIQSIAFPNDAALKSSDSGMKSFGGTPRSQSGRTKTLNGRRVLTSRENTPTDSKMDPGNFTMLFNKTFSGDGEELDLEELTDKLGWYESVIRKLQSIFETENDDPDITYHQECTKVLERAKRMVQYREMIRDYEKTLGEQKEDISRLESLLRATDCQKEKTKTENQLNKNHPESERVLKENRVKTKSSSTGNRLTGEKSELKIFQPNNDA